MEIKPLIKTTLAVCGVFLIMAACAFAGGVKTSEKAEDKDKTVEETKQEEVKSILQDAMKAAKENGDESINVFLDEEKGLVQENDYVLFSYIATTENGKRIKLATGESGGRIEDYFVGSDSGTAGNKKETSVVIAGDDSAVNGIGKEVVGLREGEKANLHLAAKDAFGERDEKKVKTYTRIKKLDKTIKMTPEQYYKTFKEFPVPDSTIEFAPYADAKIISVNKTEAVLSIVIEEAEQHFEDTFGETVVLYNDADETVTIELVPEVGGFFNDGRIAAVEGDKFSVDYNHPLAGEDIDIEVTVENIQKPSSFGNDKINWYEDYEEALEVASESHKPVVLLLYANWCQYCEKMLGGTFRDPWVRFFRDKYVWVKIDSSIEKEFYQAFKQSSYPTTVLIDTDGNIAEKITGYKDAKKMREELIELYNRDHASV